MIETTREAVHTGGQREGGMLERVPIRRTRQVGQVLEQRLLRQASFLLPAVLDSERSVQLAVPAQRDRERARPRHALPALDGLARDPLAAVEPRADGRSRPPVGGLDAQAVRRGAEENVRVIGVSDARRLLADTHQQAARVERLIQPARRFEEPQQAGLHGYSPRVFAMMFFWISDVPP